MSETALCLRAMLPADYPYVISTWLHSATLEKHGRERHAAMVALRASVEKSLERGRVFAAFAPSQPETLHGWICTELDGRLLYLFVPKDLKHQGIEDLLYQFAKAETPQKVG